MWTRFSRVEPADVGRHVRSALFTVCLALFPTGVATAQSSAATRNTGRPLSMEVIRGQCIEFRDVKRGSGPGDFRDCRVSEFGEIGAVDRQRYYYAIYCLVPSDTTTQGECGDDSFIARYHRQRALAIFARDSSGENTQLVFERASPEIGAVLYEKPELIQNAAGTLLYLPIVIDGTGHGNESEYYLRGASDWDPIEAETWMTELRTRLPAGLEIWRGVWPDLNTMRAEAGLYRVGDSNCCPTGGIARIRLAIRARRLVIDSLVIDRTP